MENNTTERGVVHVGEMEFEYTVDSHDLVRVVHPINGEINIQSKGDLSAMTVATRLAAKLREQWD